MRRDIFKYSIVFVCVFLTACMNTVADKSNTEMSTIGDKVVSNIIKETTVQHIKPSLTIKDYYPFNDNMVYYYEGEGNEYASYTVYTDYTTANRVQIRSNNGGTEMVRVLENQNGQLSIISSKGECYYRENFTQDMGDNIQILLKEPIEIGNTWVVYDNTRRYISNKDVDVSTAVGEFKAIEVTTESEGGKTADYYAANIGLIKSVYTSEDQQMKVTSTLSKIEKNTPLKQNIRFYYPNIEDDKSYYINKEVLFYTNDITRKSIEKEMKELVKNNLGRTLSPNANINSLYLNKDNRVYIDFSNEFVNEMNAGAGYEAMILQSITNTIGAYYNAEEVCITVEGRPYEGGHIIKQKGEGFKVNLENSVEVK